MSRDHFWLTDKQFARIAPHLPTDTRGKPRVDDPGDQRDRACAEVGRPLGRRAERLWPSQNPLQPVCPLGRQGRVGKPLPRARAGQRPLGEAPHRQLGRQG